MYFNSEWFRWSLWKQSNFVKIYFILKTEIEPDGSDNLDAGTSHKTDFFFWSQVPVRTLTPNAPDVRFLYAAVLCVDLLGDRLPESSLLV
jgi:hypothetical protein